MQIKADIYSLQIEAKKMDCQEAKIQDAPMSNLEIEATGLSTALEFNARLEQRHQDRTWVDTEVLAKLDPVQTHVYLARKNRAEVSMAMGRVVLCPEPIFNLSLILTDPDHRNDGIGSEIMQHLQSTWSRITTTAAIMGYTEQEPKDELNKRLHAFYRRHEFGRLAGSTNVYYWPRSTFGAILEPEPNE